MTPIRHLSPLRQPLALILTGLLLVMGWTGPLAANPFAPGWALNKDASRLTFQSVKNNSKVETSTFASFEGSISPEGLASLLIQLESVDTGIDLRNVRMRFLFFETFKYPEARVSLDLNTLPLSDLATRRRMTVDAAYSISMHGVTAQLQSPLVITLISDNMVSVATAAPISIAAADFDLVEGILKLQDAAKVQIVPSASVSFDFIFEREGVAPALPTVAAATPTPTPAATPAPTPAPVSAAVEPTGNFSAEACIGRFEILSRTGAIYFASGSAQLSPDSAPLLGSVVDIIQRCPDLNIRVAGHTDSAGGARLNQSLSEARARSVASYLIGRGVAATRIRSVGFGEDQPVAPNDTARNRGRNRRIEFSVAG